MVASIPLRCDYDGAMLRRLAKASWDANQTLRLLALSVIYDGGRRGEAPTVGGVGLQVIRDWVLRFNVHGPDRLIDGEVPGQVQKFDVVQRRALARLAEGGGGPCGPRRGALAA